MKTNVHVRRVNTRTLSTIGFLGACAAALLASGGHAYGQAAGDQAYANTKVVRVHIKNAADARLMGAISEDPWTCRYSGDTVFPATADFRVPNDALDAIKSQGIEHTVLVDDVQALVDAETARLSRPVRGPGWFSDFKDLAAVNTQLDAFVAAQPTMVSRVTVGNSIQGRPIPCVRIAAPGTPVNSKPQVVIIGCQHAREWITVMGTMYFADALVNQFASSASVQRLLNSYEFYIVPVTNPDGYVYTWPTALGGGGQRLWRKNRRNNGSSFGVDLNRNWGYGWGGVGTSTSPSSDIYRGPSAFSEPETLNVSNFVSTLPNVVMFYDVHSYSQLILEPWGDTFVAPPQQRTFTQLGGAMQNAAFAASGLTYLAGNGYRVIYPTSGVADEWSFGTRGSLAIAFELRDTGQFGFVLPADQIVPASQELQAMLNSSLNWMIDNTVSIDFPNAKPARVAAGGSTEVLVQFQQGLKKLGNLVTSPPSVSVRQGRTGAFATSTLPLAGTDETGTVYTHNLTGGICGSVVQWYYTVTLSDGSTVTLPAEGAAKPYEAVAQEFSSVLSTQTFEAAPAGWVVGDTTDTPAGAPSVWVRSDPNGTETQVEYDHTPLTGVNCYFTGQNARNDPFGLGRVGESSTGTNQVQQVSLLTPVMNVPATTAEISFWLTFANSRQYAPDDAFSIDYTLNASAPTPTWTNLLTIAPNGPVNETTARWNRYSLRLSQATALGSSVRLRFVAREDGNGDSVEAALDDFAVSIPVCERPACPGDFSGDGVASVQDIFDFLSAWFAGSPMTDYDHNSVISVQDLFTSLSTWFAGCP